MSTPHQMTSEETIAFLEGHEDETFALAKQLANVISYENGVELNALRMMRLLEPVMRDKTRLDALQDNRWGVWFNDLHAGFTVQRHGQVVGNLAVSRDIRTAIDDARKA